MPISVSCFVAQLKLVCAFQINGSVMCESVHRRLCQIMTLLPLTAGMVSTEDEDDMPYDMYTDDVGDRQARDKGESEERDKGESEEKQDDRDGNGEHEQKETLDQMQENAITDLVSVISYHNRTMKGSHLQ